MPRFHLSTAGQPHSLSRALKTGCVANWKHHFVSRSRQGKPPRCCPGRHPGGPRWTPLRPSCPAALLPTTTMSYRLRFAAALVARCGRLASLASCVLSLVRLCLSGHSSRLATAHLNVVPRPCGSSNRTSSRAAPAPAAELSTPCYSRQCPRHTLAANCSSVSAVTVFPITNA
jgi:hypothetical protein